MASVGSALVIWSKRLTPSLLAFVSRPVLRHAAAGARHDHADVVGGVGVADRDGGRALAVVGQWVVAEQVDGPRGPAGVVGLGLVREAGAGLQAILITDNVGAVQATPRAAGSAPRARW